MIPPHWIIAISLVSLGIILFFYLASRKKYRDATAAPNYEQIRNKVTLREKEPEVVIEDIGEYSGGGGMLGNLIGGFIVILVGTSLAPEISKIVNSAAMESNLTGSSETMLTLVPLFFTLAIVVASLSMMAKGLNNAGII